jgi:alpha-L-rhamnosidase
MSPIAGPGLRRIVAVVAAAVVASGLVAFPVAADPTAEPPLAHHLTVDQRSAPVDVEAGPAPVLGWQVDAAQTAYRVQVATAAALLEDAPDVWDSSRVASAQSTNVPYAGPGLTPEQGYYWRVRTWDADGRPSGWSHPARFGTGPGSDWGDAAPVWVPQTGPEWADYTIDTTFRIAANNASITFRAKDANNYYMWQLRGNGVNTLAPHKRVNGVFTQLKSVPVGKVLANNTDYRLRIVAVGSTITTYLDGVLIDTTQDTTWATGRIGFRTGGTEQNSWDDLTVTDTNGTVLYDNDFSAPSSDFGCATVSGGRLVLGTSQNCVYAADSIDWAFLRGDVDLAPEKDIAWATVFATAASPRPARQYVYKLWLNGRFVGLGPTQPIKDETRYDGYDVTALLKPGAANTLGALAYTTSDQRFLAHLVVKYTDGTRQTFGTGPSWRAVSGSSVYPAVGSIGTSYYVAPKENLQAAEYPFGFATPGFDDAGWLPVQVKGRFAQLEATPTAKVQEQRHLPVRVVEKSPGNYFLDYGRTWVGGMSLDLTGTAGQVVDLRFGEALSGPQTVRFAMATGNTYQDKWTLVAGPQHLETWGMRVFRYAEVLGAPSGLGAQDFPALAQVYPFDRQAGVFDSSDETLNKVWQLSKNTIEATNGNLYVDSWTRERGAYEADSYLQMMSNFFLSEDPTLGNYSIDYLLTGRTWPTEWPMYLILAMHDSFQQTGDIAAVSRSYDALKAKLPTRWLEEPTGLVRKDTGSSGAGSCTDCDIVDWPASERDGYVFRPYNTVINAIAYRSFSDMAAIARALGKDADAASFSATAARLRDAVNERMFDPVRGAYRDGLNADGSPVDHFAIQASVFATAFGVADPPRAAQTAEYIRTRGMTCSVYCAAFLLEALYNGDRADVAYAMLTSTGLRSWMNMINQGAGATMEAWDPSLKSNLTYSHPWAASPAYNVPRGLFGIRPTTPGYSTFDVKPQPDSVTWAHATLPTLKGRIGVAFHTVGVRTDVSVHVPGNTRARVYLPGAVAGDDTAFVDGVETKAEYSDGYLRIDGLDPGCHLVSQTAGRPGVPDPRLSGICPGGRLG